MQASNRDVHVSRSARGSAELMRANCGIVARKALARQRAVPFRLFLYFNSLLGDFLPLRCDIMTDNDLRFLFFF